MKNWLYMEKKDCLTVDWRDFSLGMLNACVHIGGLSTHFKYGLLFIFAWNVNKIWKLLEKYFKRMFLMKCHIRPLLIYSEVALFWSQRKVKGNIWFSLWLLNIYVHRGGPITNFKKNFNNVFFPSQNWVLWSHDNVRTYVCIV